VITNDGLPVPPDGSEGCGSRALCSTFDRRCESRTPEDFPSTHAIYSRQGRRGAERISDNPVVETTIGAKLPVDLIGVAASGAGVPAILGRVKRRGKWREKQSRKR
jgi:hypothetical protein